MMDTTDRRTKAKGRHQVQRLTALAVSKFRTPGFYNDGHGLYLKVDDSGAKRWVQRIVIQGKRCDLGLKSIDLVSLSEARETALENRRIARAGGDPREAKRQVKAIPTFDEARDEVIKLREGGWKNPKSAKQWSASLEQHITPVFGSKRVSDVSKADVIRAMSPIWSSRPETARRIKQRLGLIFEWAKAHGYRSDDPSDAINMTFGKLDRSKRRNHPALPHQQVAAALAKVRKSGAAPVTKLAFEFVVLTAARSGEVREAEWREFDIENAIWVVPPGRMKAGKEHRVPLSDSALKVLAAASELRQDDCDLVFPAPGRKKSLSDITLSKLAKELALGAVPHGFRSSFRDWAAEETNYPREVMERALAHVTKDKAEAAYFRSDLFDKRRSMMQEWSDYIAH